MSKVGRVRSNESGGDGVRCDIKARGEVEGHRERLDVVVSKGVWNCGKEWFNETFRVPSTE